MVNYRKGKTKLQDQTSDFCERTKAVWRGGAGLVLLDVVLGQEDPVLHVRQGGAEVQQK